MLNLTWMPTVLRNHSGTDIRHFKHSLRRPNSGSSLNSSINCGGSGGGCLGHCTAPSPVSNQHNGPNGPSNGGSIGAGGNNLPSGNLAALLSATQSAAAVMASSVIGEDDFCAYCQDVCWWFELASLLCHHLAPASPPALPRLELSVTAISAFLTKPGELYSIPF